jgi:hypothetical protein
LTEEIRNEENGGEIARLLEPSGPLVDKVKSPGPEVGWALPTS